jgi:Uncharacterized conserved protein
MFKLAGEGFQTRVVKLSLSKMIFTYQIVRMILLEQVYRALTILKNEKYHH